jgi:lysophospholipase L1-like esterase
MKKIFFNLFLVISIIVSVALAVFVVFIIGEKYFFDQLFYKKSTTHGYYPYHYPGFTSSVEFYKADNLFFKDPRHKDIGNIFNDSQDRVLGAKSENSDYKIAILGDSISYGLGVRSSQSYPVLLEKYLNDLEIKGVNFDVLNYSMSGDDILDHYVKYLKARKRGDIDLYVLQMLSNDFFIKRDDKYPGKNEAYNRLVELCGGIPMVEPDGYGEEGYQQLLDQATIDVSKNNINNCFFNLILNDVRGEDMMAFSNYFFNYNECSESIGNQADAIYADHLLNEGIEIWRFPTSYLDIDFEKLELSALEGHPNPTTHKVYAYYLASSIVNERLNEVISDEDKELALQKLERLLLQQSAKLR